MAGLDYSNLLNFCEILTLELVGRALADGSCKVDWLVPFGDFIPLRSPPVPPFIDYVSWLLDLTLD